MSEDNVKLQTRNLLWFVNGKTFEFEFICIAKEPNWQGGWRQIIAKILGSQTQNDWTYYGVFQNCPFIAVKFHDAHHKDSFGRPIVHRILWFPPELKGKPKEDIFRIPSDWVEQMRQKGLETIFDEVYALEIEDAAKRVEEMENISSITQLPSTQETERENWEDIGEILLKDLNSEQQSGEEEKKKVHHNESQRMGNQFQRMDFQQNKGEKRENFQLPELDRIAAWGVGGAGASAIHFILPVAGIALTGLAGVIIADHIYRRFMNKAGVADIPRTII